MADSYKIKENKGLLDMDLGLGNLPNMPNMNMPSVGVPNVKLSSFKMWIKYDKRYICI